MNFINLSTMGLIASVICSGCALSAEDSNESLHQSEYAMENSCDIELSSPEGDYFEGAENFVFNDVIEITQDNVFNVSELQAKQLVKAVRISASYSDVETAIDAVQWVDEDIVNYVRGLDTRSGAEFDIYEFGLGDNSYGAVFHADTLSIAAEINDGDLDDCNYDSDASACITLEGAYYTSGVSAVGGVDSCNTCKCNDGEWVGCTRMYCGE